MWTGVNLPASPPYWRIDYTEILSPDHPSDQDMIQREYTHQMRSAICSWGKTVLKFRVRDGPESILKSPHPNMQIKVYMVY